MAAMERFSRACTRSSRSSKRQFNRRLRARPTLLLPDPIKPTRNTARVRICDRSAGGSGWCHESCLPAIADSPASFFLAFLKANFTTEGTQNHGRSCLTDSASKGTSCNERKRRMGLGGEGKIILHQTPYGTRSYIN